MTKRSTHGLILRFRSLVIVGSLVTLGIGLAALVNFTRNDPVWGHHYVLVNAQLDSQVWRPSEGHEVQLELRTDRTIRVTLGCLDLTSTHPTDNDRIIDLEFATTRKANCEPAPDIDQASLAKLFDQPFEITAGDFDGTMVVSLFSTSSNDRMLFSSRD